MVRVPRLFSPLFASQNLMPTLWENVCMYVCEIGAHIIGVVLYLLDVKSKNE